MKHTENALVGHYRWFHYSSLREADMAGMYWSKVQPPATANSLLACLHQLNCTQCMPNSRSQTCLQRLLPQGVEVPTSFEMVGHLVHLNLRDEQLPYKNVIGQVWL
jgi:hypothetical protein